MTFHTSLKKHKKKIIVVATISIFIIPVIISSALNRISTDDRSEASSQANKQEQYLFAYNFDSKEAFASDSIPHTKFTESVRGKKFVNYAPENIVVSSEDQVPCYGSGTHVCGQYNVGIQSGSESSKVERDFPGLQNAILSIKFYDDGKPQTSGVVAISDNSNKNRVWFGVNPPQNSNNYVYQLDDTYYDSEIPRSEGWKHIDFYITGQGAYLTVNKKRINSHLSDLRVLNAVRMFSFGQQEQGGIVRFDHLLVYNNVFPEIKTTQVEKPLGNYGNGLAPQVNHDREKTEVNSQRFDLVVFRDGVLHIKDKLHNVVLPGLPQGAFYDGEQRLKNINYVSTEDNIVHFMTKQNGKEYSIYLKLLPESVLFSMSSPHAFLPAIKMQPQQYMYGLGENVYGGNLFIDKGFNDPKFSTGNLSNGTVNSDIGRMRTPILMSPQSGVGYALFDDTQKHIIYDEHQVSMGLSEPGTSFERAFAIFTASNPEDLYRNYHKTRLTLGYPVYTPKYANMSQGYELFGDYGCLGDGEKIINRVEELSRLGIPVHFITIGSGYWSGKNALGCNNDGRYSKIHDVSTDSFTINKNRYPESFWEYMKKKDINILIGMRTNISLLRYDSSIDNYQSNPTAVEAQNNNFLITNEHGDVIHTFFEGGTHLVYLDATQPEARSWFLEKVKQYPNITGFKDDTMGVSSIGYNQFLTENKTYPMLAEYSKNGYLQRCRNDYFSLACDLTLTPGYHTGMNRDPKSMSNGLDKALQLTQHHAFSGYYISGFEIGTSLGLPLRDSAEPIAPNDEKIAYRAVQFGAFMPNLSHSFPIWTTKNKVLREKYVYFSQLQERLRRYHYNAAVESFNTGIPLSFMPLVIQYPEDVKTYNTGRGYSNGAYEENNTANSTTFMVGRGMLIAPLTSLDWKRDVYLPNGTWYDLFTGE
ncbi:MAG: TIM-barrel domain-containing protein, partial [Candidatus Dojkabacteria bacterium]